MLIYFIKVLNSMSVRLCKCQNKDGPDNTMLNKSLHQINKDQVYNSKNKEMCQDLSVVASSCKILMRKKM